MRFTQSGEDRPTLADKVAFWLISLWAALLLAIVSSVSPLENGGPGITCDEGYRLARGKTLIFALRQQGLSFWTPTNIRKNFPWSPDSPPFHPPVGHLLIGLVHSLFDPAPDDPTTLIFAAGRFSGAVCLAALVLLVGWWTLKYHGRVAALATAVAVPLFPRFFGHCLLVSLDSWTAFFCTAAVLAVATAREKGTIGAFTLAGIVWGLALATRLHGWLLAPPVLVWLLYQEKLKGLRNFVVWFVSGVVVLYLLWPWLWLDPIGNLLCFFQTTGSRVTLHTYYLGQVWQDRSVPWHYPLVMAIVTTPVGLLVLIGIGKLLLWRKRPDHGMLLIMCAGTLVFVFCLPGIPVYDGVRLFLPVFPLAAIWVGVTVSAAAELATGHAHRAKLPLWLAVVCLFWSAPWMICYHPFYLSYYNLLVGGLAGASRLGFEVDYWGVGLTERLLRQAALHVGPKETVGVCPSLATFHYRAVNLASPALLEKEILVVPWPKGEQSANVRMVILFNRRAELGRDWERVRTGTILAETRRLGIWLARVVWIDSGTETPGGSGYGTDR